MYKKLRNDFTGVLTGKGLDWGGSKVRTEATGYGLCYFMEEALRAKDKSFAGATVSVSGSGNVAIYATEKVHQLGGKVVTMSDSNGYIHDPAGVDLATVKRIKEVERGRISTYLESHPGATYHEGCNGIWSVKCDIALPSATQNELDGAAAETLVANGCQAVGEGANMPSTPEAIEVFQRHKVIFGPAKAANAGGVATSALEMCQNSMRYAWTFDEVDARLKRIMADIHDCVSGAARDYGCEDNLVAGANIAGFLKVARAMHAQGIAC